MNKLLSTIAVVVLLFAGLSEIKAQTLKLQKQVIGAGGFSHAKSQSSDFKLSGTVAQTAAEKRADGGWQLWQGYWLPMFATSVENGNSLSETRLMNYPNPFNARTSISYELPGSAYVTIRIYDMNGSEVNTAFSGMQDAGQHLIEWTGKDNWGVDLGSGSYLYELDVKPFGAGVSSFKPFSMRNVMVMAR